MEFHLKMDRDIGAVTGEIFGAFTERLEFLRFTEQHITPSYLGWLSSPESSQFLSTNSKTQTKSSVLAYLEQKRQNRAGDLVALVDRKSMELRGTLGLSLAAYEGQRALEVGILIGYPGAGLGQEVVAKVVKILSGRSVVRFLVAGIDKENIRSRRLFESSGFSLSQAKGQRDDLWILDLQEGSKPS